MKFMILSNLRTQVLRKKLNKGSSESIRKYLDLKKKRLIF